MDSMNCRSNEPFPCLSLSLQLEVSQLEGSLQQPKAQSSMSPYLVPDTAVLCQHLGLLRQLAASGCFIIIIPRTGQSTSPNLDISGEPGNVMEMNSINYFAN